MNRNIKYNGKELKEMTLNELESQYKKNKIRFIYRTIFFILIACNSIFYDCALTIVPVALAIITGYWLVENNIIIKKEIEIR